MNKIDWLLLVLTFPSDNATARMRFWRALKAKGCAVLRDGAYLLPFSDERLTELDDLAAGINDAGGNAQLLFVSARDDEQRGYLRSLFDRSAEYAIFQRDVAEARKSLGAAEADVEKQLKRVKKDFEAIQAMDFFPNEASVAGQAALQEFVALANKVLSPGEPHAEDGVIRPLRREDYQGRTWATRRRMWVDRVASAWLINRFIDTKATFIWVESPATCPADALGFDFDGAAFTHVGDMVTFEVLVASFSLEDVPGMIALGRMIHALDIGGFAIPEAVGFEAVVAGARQRGLDDEAMLAELGSVLDSMLAHYATPQRKS